MKRLGPGLWYHDALESLLVPIDAVRPHPDNPNNADVAAILESIRHNGIYRPTIALKDLGYLLAGNGLYAALREAGSEMIPVLWADESRHILLGDNRIAQRAVMDDGLLLDLLEKVNVNEGLYGSGYIDSDLIVLRTALARLEHTPLLPSDGPYEPRKPLLPPVRDEVPPREPAQPRPRREPVRFVSLPFPATTQQIVLASLNAYRDEHGLATGSQALLHLLGLPIEGIS